jgi:hypothetical protein
MPDLSAADDPVMPAIMSNRSEDNWRALVAIADLLGGEWPDRVHRVAESMVSVASLDEQSAGPMVLADIKRIFVAENVNRLSTEALLNALLKLDDRPWGEWKNGKPMTKAGLSRLLGKFGVVSQTVRIGSLTAKGYHLPHFEDAFSRYLPPETVTMSQANKDGDFLQNESFTPDRPVTFSKCEKPLRHSDCDVVTVCGTPHGERGGGEGAENADAFQAPPEAVCAQCGAGVPTGSDAPSEWVIGRDGRARWVHPECRRFWQRVTS